MRRKRHAILLAPIALLTAVFVVAGCGSDESVSPNDEPIDAGPLTAPSNVSVVKASVDGFELAWDASPDARVVGYNVYRYDPDPSRENAYSQLNARTVANTSFGVSAPGPDEELYVSVRSVDRQDRESVGTTPILLAWSGGDEAPFDQGDSGRDSRSRDPYPSGPDNPSDGGSTHPQPSDPNDGGDYSE